MRGSLALAFLFVGSLQAQEPPRDAAQGERYRRPSKEVLEVLHAPLLPFASINPTRDAMLLPEVVRFPTIADLAQPMLRLAGVRINPATNARSGTGNADARLYATRLTLKRLPDGSEPPVELPPGARVWPLGWSPDGARFAFTNLAPDGLELWVGESGTGKVRRIKDVRLNDVLSAPAEWLPDGRTLIVKRVPPGRAAPPPAPAAPPGPNVQETASKSASSTYEARDALRSPHDEALFEHYAASQLTLVDAASGETRPIGEPALYHTPSPAPDGEHLLVERLRRPYSRLHTYLRFPTEIEVWNRRGQLVHSLASLPLADEVPIEGVRAGPRYPEWRPTEPATLEWAEALDGGDPRKKVPHRDRVLVLKAPFKEPPLELFKTEHRLSAFLWGERDGLLIVSDYDRDRRWRRTFAFNANDPSSPRLLWEHSATERYKNPGSPLLRALPTGHAVLQQSGDAIYLAGTGASSEGDRPFLDRFDVRTLKAERLFRCDRASYETVMALLDPGGRQFITRRETPNEPPNYFIRTITGPAERPEPGEGAMASSLRPVTTFADPTPQLRGIGKRLVTHKRADGVDLSLTVYLPSGYVGGTRLPTVLYAYPLEYTDPSLASQVVGSSQRFTTIGGASHLFFLLAGYAVIEPTMPVVGSPRTVYDTFVEQLVANARAAIEKAVEMGVTDPNRVGVAGHSHGGLMAANLLAHSDLFRAGIARSGAHNKTLTAFGFQTERRTLWEALDTYIRVSPLFYANKIKDPLLLIHGERDANPGTTPMQSERLYEAIRGNGGRARLVMLPLESHGYVGRESVEHTLYEMIAWFDRHVKNAPPRAPAKD